MTYLPISLGNAEIRYLCCLYIFTPQAAKGGLMRWSWHGIRGMGAYGAHRVLVGMVEKHAERRAAASTPRARTSLARGWDVATKPIQLCKVGSTHQVPELLEDEGLHPPQQVVELGRVVLLEPRVVT